jgi:recombination protein RecT
VTETVTNAVAKRDAGPGAMVQQYSGDFRAVLPSHIKPEQWVRLAQGALKKGKKAAGGRTELEIAAGNNPGVFLASLLDAARLGLEPGTEQYYLTPRKVKGQYEILGIVGYQGLIELMYRAGAISSVVAECVYTGDQFQYRPGVDERPQHEIDWDAEDRGQLRLVYSYAVMKDGATSKVVVMNRSAIAKIRAKSAGADYDSSPWQTAEPAMWLKSAVRQLAKWVPTSAEFMREQLRAVRDVANEPAAPAPFSPPGAQLPEDVVDVSHHPVESVFDAEIVESDPRDDG